MKQYGDEELSVIAEIARMYYVEGMSQIDIANMLFFSKAKVSRALRIAREENIIETNYPAFTVPRGFKCRNNREINDTHTNLTTSIYYSKPSSITSPVESKRTELRALR